jgi:hypothetical protein
MVSKTEKDTGAWVHGFVQGRSLTSALENTSQAKVYTIKACAVDNLGATETSIFYQTVKLQLKHLTITR